ncbi:MAG: hypothetical protein JKY19_01135 [Alcanivoracaceae bacterium]|nr:hypothetical protein [Alcanivoracaceae bacterium]
MNGIITLILLNLCSFSVCESEKIVEEHYVMVIDNMDVGIIENFLMLHTLKIIELKLVLPKKGDSMEGILKNLTSLKSVKLIKKEEYIYLEEIKSQTDNKYTFKMKFFFKDNLYIGGIVTNSDGTW